MVKISCKKNNTRMQKNESLTWHSDVETKGRGLSAKTLLLGFKNRPLSVIECSVSTLLCLISLRCNPSDLILCICKLQLFTIKYISKKWSSERFNEEWIYRFYVRFFIIYSKAKSEYYSKVGIHTIVNVLLFVGWFVLSHSVIQHIVAQNREQSWVCGSQP